MWILKRYYTLYNILSEAAMALKAPIKLLLENTKFADHFDCVLFHKFMF